MKRNRIISSSLAVVVTGIVVLVIAVSGGSASKGNPTPVNGGSAVSIKHTSLGSTLVDANGRTLYLFQADRRNVSTLSRAGFAVWPAFTSAGKPQARGGVSAAHIGTIAGPKGTRLVTYYGHPLYYYVGDKKSGEANGQGLNEFGARWFVLSANGTATTSAPVAPAPATSESSGYGY
jgi:predicted lipoprotein with Yx(FWY)xxD motif